MSVIRIKHQKNYVVINKNVLEDKNLSFKAKGIWAYCMSRPDDWHFHVSHLISVSEDGKDSVYAGLKELENHGYLTKVQERESGKFGKFDYEISEIKIILPQREKPDTEKPDTENPPLLNTDSIPSTDLSTSHLIDLSLAGARERGCARGDETRRDELREEKDSQKEETDEKSRVSGILRSFDEDRGTLEERVAFWKSVVFPGEKTISPRNVQTWTRLFTLWRAKKAVARIVTMIESGSDLTNPEGLLHRLLNDPHMESTREIEEKREKLYAWIRNQGKGWTTDGDYIVARELDKELPLSKDYDSLIEEMKRWLYVE